MQQDLPVARRSGLAAGIALLAVVLVRWPVSQLEGGFAHLTLPGELALLVAAAVVLAFSARAVATGPRDRVETLTLALGVLVAASTAFAANGALACRSASLWLAGGVVFIAARAAGAGSRRWPLVAVLGLIAASVVLEALGVAHGLSPRGHAPGGLLGERNLAAELLVLGLPLVASVAVAAEGARMRGAACVAASLTAAAIALSRTRSAWLAALALAVAGAWWLWGEGRAVRMRALVLAGAIVLGACLAPLLDGGLRWRSPHPYRDTAAQLVDRSTPSARGRLVSYGVTLRIAAAHPLLGVGPGNWAGQYQAHAERGDPTVSDGPWPTNRLLNSDVLSALAELGVPAFLLVLALVVLLWREPGPSQGLRRGVLLAVAVVCALDAVVTTPAPLLLVAWLLGVTTPVAAPAATPARARWLGLALASVLLVLSAGLALRRLRAFTLWADRRELAALARAVSLDGGDTALRLTYAAHLFALGRCAEVREQVEVLERHVPRWPAARVLAEECATAR